MFPWNEPSTSYQVVIYPIASHLWRWEIRHDGDGALLRCGTAYTKAAAEHDVLEALDG
jgi:hypothetical protein